MTYDFNGAPWSETVGHNSPIKNLPNENHENLIDVIDIMLNDYSIDAMKL